MVLKPNPQGVGTLHNSPDSESIKPLGLNCTGFFVTFFVCMYIPRRQRYSSQEPITQTEISNLFATG